jgi:hypothetical protein
MRLKYDENERELIIKLKEEPAVYCDEGQFLYFLSAPNWVEAYYSEKGELVEFHWGIGAGYEIKWEEAEAALSDTLPWRKYEFTFGKENKIPKVLADDIYKVPEIGDRFSESGGLIIHRRDGNEMDYHEIKGLRETLLFKCILKDKDWGEAVVEYGALTHWNIETVYKDRKLYFWTIDESFHPNSEKEFIENMKAMLELQFGICAELEKGYIEIKKRELGFDIITMDEDCELTAIICICDEEAMGGQLEKDELINVCENTIEYKGEKIKRRRIVIWGLELSKEAEEWARLQGIEVQDILEFIVEFDINFAEFNDELVEPHAQEWEERISEIFG